MGLGLRNQDFCLDLKNPKSEIRTSKYFSILTTTFWPEHAAALGRLDPFPRFQSQSADGRFCVFGQRFRKISDLEFRIWDLIPFPNSDFGPRTPAPGPSRLRCRPELGCACALAFENNLKSLIETFCFGRSSYQKTSTGYLEKFLSGETRVDPVSFAWTIKIRSKGSL